MTKSLLLGVIPELPKLASNAALDDFYFLMIIVALFGLLVFVTLYFVDAGYGKMINPKWGPTISNKIGWMIMELPVFVIMLYYWGISPYRFEPTMLAFFLIFETHYFQRVFIFPCLMRGKSKIPLVIVAFSMAFNIINGFIQGKWLFHFSRLADPDAYPESWLTSWQFILGTCIFILGFIINLHSDYVIRHLRKPGDTNHYLPKKGFYRYVTSANYFGEILEWLGWAILTWSWAGLTFFWFTCANLVPRANAIYHKYETEFADEFDSKKLKRVFPFIY